MMATLAPSTEALSAVEECARRTITARGLTVGRIIRVNSDSILFLGPHDRPMTAWLSKIGSQVVNLIAETGFLAEPSAWVVRMLGHPPGVRPEPEPEPAESSK